MTAAAVSQFLYLLDEAFQGPDWHSLLGNLRSLTPEDWTWVPPGGRRSIRDIVEHVGGCKVMYHNHAFGDAQLTWDDPLVDGGDAVSTISSAIGWLRDGQERLRHSIAALDDAALLRPRMTTWGELKETRWIVAVMIQHDTRDSPVHERACSTGCSPTRWSKPSRPALICSSSAMWTSSPV